MFRNSANLWYRYTYLMTVYNSLINIFHQGESWQTARHEVLLRAGDRDDHVYFVAEGILYSYRYGPHGDKITRTFYGPGDILPISSLQRIATVPAYFESLTSAKLHKLPASTFQSLTRHNATASYDLAMQITDQYTDYVRRVGNLQYTNAYDRIVYCLLLLSQRFGNAQENGAIQITVPLTHSLIASTVSVARETASRCLKRLAQKNLVCKEAKLLVIIDPGALAAELHDNTLNIDNLID